MIDAIRSFLWRKVIIWSRHVAILLMFLFVGAAYAVALPVTSQTVTNGYDIRITLYRHSDKSERTVTQPRLTFDAVTVPPGVTSVWELLSAFLVYPDSDAIGLTYSLNPDLMQMPVLKPHTKVRLVQIEPTVETTKALSDGFVLRIYYDEKLINELLSSRETILRLTVSASTLGPEKFGEPTSRDAVLPCLLSVSDNFTQITDHLSDKDHPTNHEMLSQLRGDVELLSAVLSKVTAPSGSATTVDVAKVCSIAGDLQTKREGFRDTRGTASMTSPWPMVRVIVNTRDAITGNPVPMLRIHFVPVALEGVAGQEQEFQTLSSPAERQLPEADYVFWVTTDQDTAVLGRVEVPIRKTEDSRPLDIAVRH